MAVASPQKAVADLRRWLAQVEVHGRAPAVALPFDIAEVDAHMPGGGIALGHFHEVIEGGAASEDETIIESVSHSCASKLNLIRI